MLIQLRFIQFCLSAIFLYTSFVSAELPVDVSFVIIDLKYHPVRGAQICEIQHGMLSGFKGYAMWHETQDTISWRLVEKLSRFYGKSWVAIHAFADPLIKELLAADPRWEQVDNFKEFENNAEFLSVATLPVEDPLDISAYHGFAFMSPLKKKERENFLKQYPGVVLIDNAFCNYADNKHRMTEALMGDPVTEKHKPKWGFYHREDADLASRITKEIGSDKYVIKPTDEYMGNGVIIVAQEELESVLEYLFDKTNNNISTKDRAYSYWKNGDADVFIVEEFIEVEPVVVPHLGGKEFCPTLRLAFLLSYNKQATDIECLGGYYTLPKISINDPGSLNERYKSYVFLPYFAKADPQIVEQATSEMRDVLKIIYLKLLQGNFK